MTRDVVAAAAKLRREGKPYLVATVVRVRGSSYRKPGARMIATERGRVAGSISGGCLEGALLRTGWWKTRTGPCIVEFDSSDPDDPDAVLGCGGVVEVLLERGGENDALAFIAQLEERRTRGTIATTLEGPELGRRRFLEGDDDVEARDDVFVERVRPPLELFVFGAGLDAIPVVEHAARLGWRTTVWTGARRFEHADRFTGATLETDLEHVRSMIDTADRAFAVVMSHDLRRDAEALAMLVESRAAYIGVLGPTHRTARLGIPNDPRVHSPVGLPIGAEGAEEIAISIVAEIVAKSR